MPLVTRFGFPQSVPQPNPDGIPTPSNPTMQAVLDQQPYIKDTFVNKTAYNPETYADEFGLLQRYAAGSRIQVTYFMLSTPTGGMQRADMIDQSNMRSPNQTSYTQINNLEIAMQGGLQSSFDGTTTESKVFGEALLYPGLRPRLGDTFVTSIGDGVFGIFIVTSVTRLTYRQGANHRINFFLSRYAQQADIDILKQSVTQEVWFDKDTYLGDSTTLLKSNSYSYLQTLRKAKMMLTRYYYNTFYDKSMNTIMAPNGTYDPYLVNFLNSIISIRDSIHRPLQLYSAFQNYENTIWGRLCDPINNTLINLQSGYNYVLYQVTRYDVYTTALVNRQMIYIFNPNAQAIATESTSAGNSTSNIMYPPIDGGPSSIAQQDNLDELYLVSSAAGYVLSTNFYTSTTNAMTSLEYLIYEAITLRAIASPDFISEFINGYLSQYTQLTLDEQYYYIPLYLWLIEFCITNIAAPNSFMT